MSLFFAFTDVSTNTALYSMIRTYKYRIYPNQEQRQFIENHIGACRFVYNWGLNLRIETYKQTNKGLSFYDTGRALTQLKQQDGYGWLYEIGAQSLEASLKDLDSAYTAFFKYKSGFPRFKTRKYAKQAFHIRQDTRLDQQECKLYIRKLKTSGIKVIIDRPLRGKIKNGTITKTPTGKYYVSLQVETDDVLPELPLLDIGRALGIDLGLTHFATLSNGTKIDNPRYLKHMLAKLRYEQHILSRKQKGSQRYEKQRIKVAKVYEKITNQRMDFLHKLTTRLVNDSQVDTFCLEDLNIAGMLKNHSLARSIADVSWSKFIQLLTYKCSWYGKNLLFIGRFEPSSKLCECGKINHDLKLSDREWYCQHCGLVHDRDILAANNIKHFAFNTQNMLYIGSDRSKYKPVENESFHSAKREIS